MIKVFLLSSLDAQSALGLRHFSFKVQNLPIFKVLNLRKENFNRLALWYLSCTIPRSKFDKELKKNLFISFLVKWKYLRKTRFRAYFHGLCLIAYKSVNRR